MPQETDAAESGDGASETEDRRSGLSGFGLGSAALGLLCVAAIVLTSLIWSAHREERDDLNHQARVMQTAFDWAGVLINMNKDNVQASVAKLHESTVGTLNTDLDRVIEPLTNLVKTLQLKTTGQVNAVAIESVHRANPQPGTPPPDETLGGLASRTDTVLIIATLAAENAGGKRPPTSLNLRIGVSDVDGQLLVSNLELLR